MKKILLLISFSILLRPVLPYMEYVLRYDYIVAFLCINKEDSSMSCNGKCYLTASLGEVGLDLSSDDYEHSVPKNVEISNLLYVVMESPYFDPLGVWDLSNLIFNNYNINYSYLFVEDLFKPPIVA